MKHGQVDACLFREKPSQESSCSAEPKTLIAFKPMFHLRHFTQDTRSFRTVTDPEPICDHTRLLNVDVGLGEKKAVGNLNIQLHLKHVTNEDEALGQSSPAEQCHL